MWKEIKVVKNVGYDNFDARFGAYATDEADKKSILHIGDKENLLDRVTCVKSYSDKVVVQVDDGVGLNDSMLYTKDGELLSVVKHTNSITAKANLRYLNVFMLEGENYDGCYNIVDIETGRVIFKEYVQGRKLFVFNDMIFSNRDNIVIRYDWDGSILWQHNYEPDFNVTIDLGFVLEGVCGGKLWVKSKHDWHEILLAIDVNTGELVKAFSDSEEDTNLPHCDIGDIGDAYLNLESNHILVVTSDKEGNDFLNFVDAKTLEVFERTPYSIDYDYDNGKEDSLGGITGFQSNYITFWLERYHVDSMPSGFVVYNYNKKEVVFAHRLFTPEQTGKGRYLRGNTTRIPFYNNGLIYVHDNCDTLHIFEDVKE
ncbi:MAG: hypothetical protein J5676_07415 [Bacteroidaceae bacterium]|nr:hypothetical protein [Bacteroidaceae bacterium]